MVLERPSTGSGQTDNEIFLTLTPTKLLRKSVSRTRGSVAVRVSTNQMILISIAESWQSGRSRTLGKRV